MIDVVIDIETIAPSGQMREYAQARFERTAKAPKNYKDPEKIEAYKANDVAEKMERLPLHTAYAEVCCIGIGYGDIRRVFGRWDFDDEAHMLDEFCHFWLNASDDHGGVRWMGKGIKRFDFPILRTRLIAAGYQEQRHLYFPRFETRAVVDLEDEAWWPHNDRRGPSLEAMCVLLGIEPPEGSGADVAAQWAAGDVESIARHCLSDVEKTTEVLRRLGAL